MPAQVIERSNYVPFYKEISKPGEVIYDKSNIKLVYERLRNISSDYDELVSEQLGDLMTQTKPSTVLFRWWSLYMVLEIIEGRGDFFAGVHKA